ncbi:bifunctional ADP-dependent NAD(P)H-hydrate dehydratase/NAD(P)H-hydrate epimerase [Roseobacter sp. SK209-2-6]|uniref:bifunctional ADP-dependent NAD(P)H-hydrate dehydratase/NAD(P)H-hydrate epimerase n=1 Tax=Roseobacter sp. SK209-2-6 TaxID=388739 RepID=UPI0002EC49CC|nr:bifunctional ADP-dependent NAD(P)H-hydrate dehydratase/NAD(P)H-hydrate epimerase [Roseobacter sp. SK209-2-6]
MTELLTAAQMRAIEQAAIDSGEVTGLELMERAGQGVVEAIFEEWPELTKEREASPSRTPGYLQPEEEDLRRGVVLCGPGNNGGDGFVVARLLKEHGWEVEVFLYGDPDKLPPDAKVNYERWCETDCVRKLADMDENDFWPFRGAVFVDAVFGTGFRGKLPFEALGAYGFILDESTTTYASRFLAIDMPSGLRTEDGCTEGCVIPSGLTVTFHRMKLGHYLGSGAEACGKIVTKDIGIPKGSPRPRVGVKPPPGGGDGGCPALPDAKDIVRLVRPRFAAKNWNDNKYSHGHALVLSGGAGKTGAARLAARGALRIGAGLVTVGSPRSAMAENASHLTAIMLQQIDGAHGVSELLEDKRFNAVCLGPGLGRGADTQALVLSVLKEKRATVLDADALTRFELNPEALFEVLHENCVLTPHGGEFAKLFPDLAEKLNVLATTGPAYSKVDATREAAKRAGCVVLFKGPDTVIAAPDGRCSVNSAHYERSAPWLATAGSGDVLAGFITGLLARGFTAMQAAETAAYLHVECALEFGPGLIAEDLPEQLPAVFRRLMS